MGSKELQKRDNWQTKSGPSGEAGLSEQNLYRAFFSEFAGTNYIITEHPKDLKHLYEGVQLSEATLSEIYNPDETIMRNAQKRGWGVTPDFSITNLKTKKPYLEK